MRPLRITLDAGGLAAAVVRALTELSIANAFLTSLTLYWRPYVLSPFPYRECLSLGACASSDRPADPFTWCLLQRWEGQGPINITVTLDSCTFNLNDCSVVRSALLMRLAVRTDADRTIFILPFLATR